MDLLGWFKGIAGKETVDFTVTPALTVDGKPASLAPLKPGENYLLIKVKSLRLPFTRKLTAQMSGVVHSFADFPGFGSDAVQFANATNPKGLTALDPKNAANVITMDRYVAGPSPWWGGDLKLQIGLFSVVDQDLSGPFLETITTLSEKVGVNFIAGAKPFLDVIGTGITALSRQDKSVKLEIGLDRTFSDPVTGHYAVIAAPAQKLDGAKFDVESSDFKLMVNGQRYTEAPYIIFTIEAVEQQPRFGEIPELGAAYARISKAIGANDQTAAREATTAFRLAAMSSRDLTIPDSERLVKIIDDRLAKIFNSPLVSATTKSQKLPELGDIQLYPPN